MMKVGDPRRGRGIDKTTVCFIPERYAENKRTVLKKKMMIETAKAALIENPEDDDNEKGGARWAAIRTGGAR
jgi:hypothetical protein